MISRAGPRASASERALVSRDASLVDLLDRLLTGGVTVQGTITLAAADIDLVGLDLRILLAAISGATGR